MMPIHLCCLVLRKQDSCLKKNKILFAKRAACVSSASMRGSLQRCCAGNEAEKKLLEATDVCFQG